MNIKEKNQLGLSLMEVLISLFVIMVLTIGIYSLIIISIQLTTDNKNYVIAMGLANQKMEQIRNLPYNDVGTLSGMPHGVIPDYETVFRDGEFIVHTTVIFYDDPYDGTMEDGTDEVFTDYKIATIDVSWQAKNGTKNITVFSKVIPNTEETLAGYGLLRLSAVDANGAPVAFAKINVKNSTLTPAVNADYTTDKDGRIALPALPAIESYEITTTKEGYNFDKTYERTEANPLPTRPHLSVFEQVKTEDSFVIDKMADLTVRTVSNTLPENWQINESRPNREQINPRSGPDEDDNMFFVWQDNASSSSYILAQKYDSAKNKLWVSDLKIHDGTEYQSNPDIAVTSSGVSYMVWQDNSIELKQIAQNDSPASPLKKNFASLSNAQTMPMPGHRAFAGQASPRIKLFENNYFSTQAQKTGFNIFLDNIFIKKARANSPEVVLVGAGPGTVTGNNSSIALIVPAGVEEDDFLLAYIVHDVYSSGPPNPPVGQGWNTLNNSLRPVGFANNVSNSRGALFWKIASDSEPNNHTFTLSQNRRKAGHIRAYRGVDHDSPFSGELAVNSSPAGNILRPAPSQIVSENGSRLVCGWGANTNQLGNLNPSFPTGMGNTLNNFGWNATAASADQPVDASDSPTGEKNYNANRNVNRASFNWSLILKPAFLPHSVEVSSRGSQISSLFIPEQDAYLGGTFVFSGLTDSRLITDIAATAEGLINAQENLKNIKLFYQFDTAPPYDCSGVDYNPALAVQFGSAGAFDGPNGTAYFSESLGVEISPAKSLCLYVVLDIDENTANNSSFNISVNNPSLDVVLSEGTVIPVTPVAPGGMTSLYLPAEHNQIHYRLREDNGDELIGAWKSPQDEPAFAKLDEPIRIRLAVSNSGGFASEPAQYRIEYGKKTTACQDIAVWRPLPNDNSLDWRMSASPYFIDGESSTNIPDGIFDPNLYFSPGELKDTGNLTSAIALSSTEFTELEFSLKAIAGASGGNYCFRLTDNGSTDDFIYTSYPEINLIGDANIYIKSLNSDGTVNWEIKKVNTNLDDSEQSFPKIALTENYGTATTAVAWVDQRNSSSDIFAQLFNADGQKQWASDRQISDSANDDFSPVLAFDSNDNLILAWTAQEADSKNIYAGKFDLDGQNVWAANIKMTDSAYDEYAPALIIDNDDNIYLAWTQAIEEVETVYLAKYNASGSVLWSRQANFENTIENQSQPSVIFSDPFIFVSWTDLREKNENIYTQKYDLEGNSQWLSDQRINIHTEIASQKNSFLFSSLAGATQAVWQDQRSGVYDIFSAEFSDPEALSPIPNTPLIITGSKKIGENPIIYKQVIEITTNESGSYALPLEWDAPGYKIEINSSLSSLNIVYRDPAQPLELLPAENKTIIIYVE